MRQHITPDYREINSNFDPAPMPGETFLPVPEYEGMYVASDFGRVVSHKGKKPRVLRASDNKGYLHVALYLDGKMKLRLVHRLVALTHLGPAPTGKPFVLHTNGIKTDNRLANLRYGDGAENQIDRVLNGNNNDANKTHCPRGHAFVASSTRVDANGGRKCVACDRAHSASRYAKRTGRLAVDFRADADRRYTEIISAPDADLSPVLSQSLTQAADDPVAA